MLGKSPAAAPAAAVLVVPAHHGGVREEAQHVRRAAACHGSVGGDIPLSLKLCRPRAQQHLFRRPQGQEAAGTAAGAGATGATAGESGAAAGAAAGAGGVGGAGAGAAREGEEGASPSCRLPAMYDLACVLYHKGTNVHSGHYIAEV